jgi:Fe-S-cluster containining protein
VLLEGDELGKFGPFSIEVPIDNGTCRVIERVLPYRNGRCIFLGEDDRCTVYEDRPVNCRRFECVKGYHLGGADRSGHSRFLRLNPRVLQLLDRL